MTYYLHYLREFFSPLNVFQYITFRAGGAFLTSLLIWLFAGKWFINFLKNKKIQQSIREYGPSTHLAKAGTPTMGGLLILVAMVFSTLLWARVDNRFIVLTLLSAVYLGAVGFMDDYRKWLTKHPAGGLSDSVKMGAQVALALGVAVYLYFCPPNASYGTWVDVPYLKHVYLTLGNVYILFALFVIVGTSNAVNIADGLDGLAGGTLLVSAITFGIFSYLAGHVKLSEYLRIVTVPGAGELTVYLAAMAGACLGFLWYNAYPAEIFMGDTGSLFMGGTIGIAALCIKQELILVLVGGIFVAEAVSVILQVGSVRYRGGKRVFRMAPLHHHFEVGGMPETKVTMRFWIVAVVLALLALTSLKIR
ncbi:MAG TPA: phospho-N-acetylmuramoyl-pentapeptide-transferase [Elusimicrobiota bacterium]|nr:phospho-N-acetylmuramoyl-pentapeptide-transferase [Elusimicrobiota bacterium]